MSTANWPFLEPDVSTILAREPNPIGAVVRGDVPAVIVRDAFSPGDCQSLVRHLVDVGLMYDSGDSRIDQVAIPADRVDRWTRQGLNPSDSRRRRIDVGTSLGNLGDDKEHFLRHAAETCRLFERLFAGRPNPVDILYRNLALLAPGKRVVTAYEPDGRRYGPAIFRIHYGGYTYGPHFDSVRNRERRNEFAVYKYAHQLAGVLCVQNASQNGVSAQTILHQRFWTPEIDPLLKSGRFQEYAHDHRLPSACVELKPGDLYFFNTGLIHEVPGVAGSLPRVVLATFIGYCDDEDEIMVWS